MQVGLGVGLIQQPSDLGLQCVCPINNAILLHCLHFPHSAFYPQPTCIAYYATVLASHQKFHYISQICLSSLVYLCLSSLACFQKAFIELQKVPKSKFTAPQRPGLPTSLSRGPFTRRGNIWERGGNGRGKERDVLWSLSPQNKNSGDMLENMHYRSRSATNGQSN